MKVLLVGHENYGSREIFTKIVEENPQNQYFLFITTGLYYRKTFLESFFKLLKEASFWFCALRCVDMVLYKLKNDTMKKRAQAKNIPLYFIDDINSQTTAELIKSLGIETMVSMFTMHIYKAGVIALPKFGSIGTHPSILHEYRGLEVFFWQLANQEKKAGVSVFNLSDKIDQGGIILQEEFQIDTDETVISIYEKLTQITARMMAHTVGQMSQGTKLPILYTAAKGSYFPMPTSEAFSKFLKSGHKWY